MNVVGLVFSWCFYIMVRITEVFCKYEKRVYLTELLLTPASRREDTTVSL